MALRAGKRQRQAVRHKVTGAIPQAGFPVFAYCARFAETRNTPIIFIILSKFITVYVCPISPVP
jgi:hypothetical protein